MDYPNIWKCPNCKTENNNSKECKKCNFKPPLNFPDIWHCPNCNELNKSTKYCKNCDYPKNLKYPELWHCPKCSKLIKDSRICIYCKGKKEKIRKLDFKVSRKAFIPALIFLALFIILFSNNNHNEVITEGRDLFYFNTSTSSIILPDWNIENIWQGINVTLNNGEDTNLVYFTQPSYFSSLRTDLNRVYSSIRQSLEAQNIHVSIDEEYSYKNWEIVCFSNEEFDSCIAAFKCDQNVHFLQINSLSYSVNKTLMYESLDSFCCNC
ncbi:MAG: hypothetical protein JW791_04915 [Nanoarchaeota archaeon]|nr:hypothetical protein [Nanoarchaeota archaeon]